MEKAIETDWRCQSTTWKFLQKVGIAVIGKRRMREEEEVEGKKNRKNHFRYWTFGVRAAHKYSYTPSNHTQAFQAPSHTCLRTNWILWLFWNMRTKYIPFLSSLRCFLCVLHVHFNAIVASWSHFSVYGLCWVFSMDSTNMGPAERFVADNCFSAICFQADQFKYFG